MNFRIETIANYFGCSVSEVESQLYLAGFDPADFGPSGCEPEYSLEAFRWLVDHQPDPAEQSFQEFRVAANEARESYRMKGTLLPDDDDNATANNNDDAKPKGIRAYL